MRAFPNVHWRYIICPQVKLPGENFITKLVPLVNTFNTNPYLLGF